MADKTLREFSAPTMTNIHIGPTNNVRDNGSLGGVGTFAKEKKLEARTRW